MDHYAGALEGDSGLHNLDAEFGVLGTLLAQNDLLDELDFLRPDHFFDPLNGRIFQLATEMIDAGQRADAISMKGRLSDQLASYGGPGFLADLVLAETIQSAAVQYAREVVELATRRDLIEATDQTSRLAKSSDAKAGQLLDQLETRIADLRENRGEKASFDDGAAGARLIAQELADALEKPDDASGVTTGFRTLNDRTGGFQRGDLIVIAGRPSMGKTALGRNIAFNSARSGKKVLFLSLEMSKRQVWFRTVASEGYRSNLGVTISDLTQRRFGAQDVSEINAVMDGARSHLATIRVDDTRGLSASDVRRAARQASREMSGLDMIVIDYLGKMRHPERRYANKADLIGETTGMLKNLAGEMDVPVVVLAQLSRQVEQRDDKRPQMSDLRDSGEIEQDADVILFVYREAYYLDRKRPQKDAAEYQAWQEEFNCVARVMEVITAKQRQGEIGTDRLQYFQEFDALQDLEPDHG